MKGILIVLAASTPITGSLEDAQSFAKAQISTVLQMSKSDYSDILPVKDRGKVFDGKKAQKQIDQGEIQTGDLLVDLVGEKYRHADRHLEHRVIHKDPKYTDRRICLGHEAEESFFWKLSARKRREKLEKIFQSSQTISHGSAQVASGGLSKDYLVTSQWHHIDDCVSCDHSEMQRVLVEEGESRSEEVWVEDSHLKSLKRDCKFISKQCVELGTARKAEGRVTSPPCWRERWVFSCNPVEADDFPSLQPLSCERTWELDRDQWEPDSPPNTDMPKVIGSLSIFKAIRGDLQSGESIDARKAAVFKGKSYLCSKNVMENALYDCCFSFGGMANQVGLSHCTTDELQLGDLRSRGHCHFVGKHNARLLDKLWVSREESSYCCFSSKLARIFQEQAHDQLSMGWGTSEDPQCGGLTMDQISQVDFSKLDLSELVDDVAVTESVEARLKLAKNRLLDQGGMQ